MNGKGRRPANSQLGRARRQRAGEARVYTTLGELIAAAFDIVGNEVRSVARLVSSSDMAKVTGKRIVLV